jgi:hypothetical protein
MGHRPSPESLREMFAAGLGTSSGSSRLLAPDDVDDEEYAPKRPKAPDNVRPPAFWGTYRGSQKGGASILPKTSPVPEVCDGSLPRAYLPHDLELLFCSCWLVGTLALGKEGQRLCW